MYNPPTQLPGRAQVYLRRRELLCIPSETPLCANVSYIHLAAFYAGKVAQDRKGQHGLATSTLPSRSILFASRRCKQTSKQVLQSRIPKVRRVNIVEEKKNAKFRSRSRQKHLLRYAAILSILRSLLGINQIIHRYCCSDTSLSPCYYSTSISTVFVCYRRL